MHIVEGDLVMLRETFQKPKILLSYSRSLTYYFTLYGGVIM